MWSDPAHITSVSIFRCLSFPYLYGWLGLVKHLGTSEPEVLHKTLDVAANFMPTASLG